MSTSSEPEDEAGQAFVPADPPEPAETPALDPHGFDLADYEWVPVLRKPRKDGWTPRRQMDFIATLAETGCVADAARAVGMSERSCYRLRRESPRFAAAWQAGIAHAAGRLVDLAFDRAILGSDEPVFDKEGHRVDRRRRHNDRLLMFLLRAYMPERFRHAHQSVRTPAETPPPETPPVSEALRLLEPAPPAAPHLLMPPGELPHALELADIGDGELPSWHRGRGDAEPPPAMALAPEFERQLAKAKRDNRRWASGEGVGADGADEDVQG